MLRGPAGEAGSIGAQLLRWPLLQVISAQQGPFLPHVIMLEGQEEPGSGQSGLMPWDRVWDAVVSWSRGQRAGADLCWPRSISSRGEAPVLLRMDRCCLSTTSISVQ